MPLMSTCVARLGSRYSIILDPVRRGIRYGSLGLFLQFDGQMIAGLDDGRGHFDALPLSKCGEQFFVVDQHQTMTSVVYEAYSLRIGAKLTMEIVAPFWPRDEKTSIVPAYIVNFRVQRLDRLRWSRAAADATHRGVLRFGLTLTAGDQGQAAFNRREGGIRMEYPVFAGRRMKTPSGMRVDGPPNRRAPVEGRAEDAIVPLTGNWRVRGEVMEADFDVTADGAAREFSLAMVSYCGDALFDRFGTPMPLKYTRHWRSLAEAVAYVKANHQTLLAKSRRFDEIWSAGQMPAAVQDLTALGFQSYLMCTLWAAGERADWFSVWEGSCWFNSTVDVTYNEAMFYFACWPELLEMIFEEWSHHANDAAAETARLQKRAQDGKPVRKETFAGKVLEHDMGAGWTASGQTYPHAMPVEENADFLLLLYAHGRWWGREELFARYNALNKELVEYLLWADSKGNGFPDRGTANTIDDATPAVQYGRDNVYLGIKRMAALHAASRMFTAVGERRLASRCAAEVRKALRTLNANWLGDHWGVCLDKSAKGLLDCWTHQPLPYKVLPGWDAYSLFTTNGLVPLMMVGDLPPGISAERLRRDTVNACRACMTRYGCSHSSVDRKNVWVSTNVWRDCAGGYLGLDLLANCERYWNQQVFANGPGGEKPSCFTETSLTNDLVWYPRGAAALGLPMAMAGLTINRADKGIRKAGPGARGRKIAKKKPFTIAPVAPGRWPLLPLADWATGKVPMAVVEPSSNGRLKARVV
ncbi:MAG: glutaminase domain-containing protein [Phycisphaerae bacterium]